METRGDEQEKKGTSIIGYHTVGQPSQFTFRLRTFEKQKIGADAYHRDSSCVRHGTHSGPGDKSRQSIGTVNCDFCNSQWLRTVETCEALAPTEIRDLRLLHLTDS